MWSQQARDAAARARRAHAKAKAYEAYPKGHVTRKKALGYAALTFLGTPAAAGAVAAGRHLYLRHKRKQVIKRELGHAQGKKSWPDKKKK